MLNFDYNDCQLECFVSDQLLNDCICGAQFASNTAAGTPCIRHCSRHTLHQTLQQTLHTSDTAAGTPCIFPLWQNPLAMMEDETFRDLFSQNPLQIQLLYMM